MPNPRFAAFASLIAAGCTAPASPISNEGGHGTAKVQADALANDSSSKDCPLTEASFLGSWSSPLGDEVVKNDVHELAFTQRGGKRFFSSWLHYRPETFDATWDFRDCSVTVRHEGWSAKYGFVDNDGKRLIELPVGKDSEIFTRTKED